MTVITSPYSDAANVDRSGQKAKTGDDRALFLTQFGGLVINAYEEAMDYDAMRFIKNVTAGKSDTFPIIGRKRDAGEHNPGEVIVGGSVEHNEVEISLDKIIFDAVFIPEIDELMNHIELRGPYASQLGQSVGSLNDKRIAIMHILASRMYDVADVPQGQPTPAYYAGADLKTNVDTLVDAFFKANQYLRENDMSGQTMRGMIPHAQYLLLARKLGVDLFKAEAGGGNIRTGKLEGGIAGIGVDGSNHIPSTNITTGLTKYQGNFSTTVGHIGNKMAVGSLERRAMRLVVKDQEERLGTIMIASKFSGHGALRGECSIELRTDAKTDMNSIDLAA